MSSAAATGLLTAANTCPVSPLGACEPSATRRGGNTRAPRRAAGASRSPRERVLCCGFSPGAHAHPLFPPGSGLCYAAALFSSGLGDDTIRDHSGGKTHPRPPGGERWDRLMSYSPRVVPVASRAPAQTLWPRWAGARHTCFGSRRVEPCVSPFRAPPLREACPGQAGLLTQPHLSVDTAFLRVARAGSLAVQGGRGTTDSCSRPPGSAGAGLPAG